MRVKIPGKKTRRALQVALGTDSVPEHESGEPGDLSCLAAIGALLQILASPVQGLLVTPRRKLNIGLQMQRRKIVGVSRQGEVQGLVGNFLPAFARITHSKVVVGFRGRLPDPIYQSFQNFPGLCKTVLTDEFRRIADRSARRVLAEGNARMREYRHQD